MTVAAGRTGGARAQARAGYLFSGLYTVLLVGFGLVPAGYAVYLAFKGETGGFTLDHFVQVAQDFRYVETFQHVATYTVAFLVPSLVISIGFALLLQPRRAAVASWFRFLYYLPQALTGAAGVIVWVFMLTPAVSPVRPLLTAAGYDNLFEVLSPANLPVVLAIIAVWTSANGILLMYAALSSIPVEVTEAARLDGANSWQTAIHVKLPMIRKWVAYTVILNVAASTQLFVEPQLIAGATGGGVGENWSPLQLAYTFAYTYADFASAAALSLQLLVISVLAAVLIIKRTSLFRMEI
ncbi:sugar ABC transporter permease [Jiangella asiatica]|uniref:Sugar ABC transporter permease n=2 Tax=Jiangella asiatica TaxID=2530372 RepID=A0A4R5DBZ4_9ACTN|nr:sugar ABC transporter permease [Jiangella asiatica]